MKELVKVIAVSLVDHPDEIVVTEKETENSIILELHVAPDAVSYTHLTLPTT